MAEKDMKSLTDEQIITERKMGRRSFLTATGAMLLGAAALASGVSAQEAPAKAADPDTKDKPKKKAATTKKKMAASDPDKKKTGKKAAADPDKKKPAAKKPDEKKTDPDGARR